MTNTKRTLPEFIKQLATEKPNEIISSFIDEINIFTIKELSEQVQLLVKGFLYNGISKGTPVALIPSKTTNYLTFVLALSKVGAVIIPINEKTKANVVERILIEEKIHTLCFYADSFLQTLNKLIPNLGKTEREYLNTSKFPTLKNIITLGSIKNKGIVTTRELMLQGTHMDNIEMECSLSLISPKETLIKKIKFGDRNEKTTEILTHEEILKQQTTFPEIQNFLLNEI